MERVVFEGFDVLPTYESQNRLPQNKAGSGRNLLPRQRRDVTAMDGKFVLISGSPSCTCPDDRLQTVIRFLARFTEEILRQSGGIVVLTEAEEPSTKRTGTPLILGLGGSLVRGTVR